MEASGAKRPPGRAASLGAGAAALALLFLLLQAAGGAAAAELHLTEPDVGLAFVHAGTRSADATYVEAMGSGACVLDHDGDGWEDILLVNARYTDPAMQAALDPRSALFRNLQGAGFALVPGQLDLSAWGMGCAAADMDADGDEDVAIHTWGGPQLFRNDDGSFVNVTGTLPVVACGEQTCFGSSIAFFDADGDRDLDLYATNYNEWDGTGEPYPLAFDGQCNVLFRNLGNASWEDATAATGLADCGRDHLGLSIADFTRDGRQDVFVASDEDPDALFVAQPDGTFVDMAEAWGVDDPRGGMGIAAGELDGDGLLDIVISHFETEGFALYRGNASGGFDDLARSSGLHDASMPHVGWGIEWVDLDHDGDQDLLGVNGHIPGLMLDDTDLGETPLVLDNVDGTLQDVTPLRWQPAAPKGVSRGLAMADFDQDGDMDFVVADNANESARFVRADVRTGNWLQVDPEGDALGALVEVDVGGRTLRREIVAASSYQSQSTRVAHVGLGDAVAADTLRVRFADGTLRDYGPVDANQRLLAPRDGELVVQRASPLAALPALTEVGRGETILLAGTVLRAEAGSTFELLIDNETVDDGGSSVERAWSTLGEHELRFRILAPDGRVDEALGRLRVTNVPPVPNATLPATADRLTPTLLDGSASLDPDGSIVAMTWSVEGATYDGPIARHAFRAPGDHEVMLDVVDDDGARATLRTSVSVVNLAPVARAGDDRASNRVALLPFFDAGSHDPEGTTLSWRWDFGDGTVAEGAAVTHRFSTLGEHVVRLTVTDAEGSATTDALLVNVTDQDLAPLPSITGPTVADRASPAVFDARASVDLDGKITRYAWAFGDGSRGEGEVAAHQYRALGRRTVTLAVEDAAGRVAAATWTVEVVNLAPRVGAPPLALQDAPGRLRLDADAVDADGAVVAHRWTLQGVAAGSGPTLEADLPAYGAYAWTLEVEDDEGALTRAEGTVRVRALPAPRIEAPAVADRVSAVAFDARGSTDADGAVVGWTWRFSDGSTWHGARIERSFHELGPQEVALEVEDDEGYRSVASWRLVVENLPPRIGLDGAREVVNLGQTFPLSAWTEDPDGPPPSLRWTIDGVEAGEGGDLLTSFSTVGEHEIRVVARDADGAVADVRLRVRATDELGADVTTTRDTYTVDRPIEGAALVTLADGSPARDAEVRMQLIYHAHDARALDGRPDLSFTLREIVGRTDANGTYTFRLDDAWPDPLRPFAPRVRPTTDPCAHYELALETTWLDNLGQDSATFRVTLVQPLETVCTVDAKRAPQSWPTSMERAIV